MVSPQIVFTDPFHHAKLQVLQALLLWCNMCDTAVLVHVIQTA